LVVERDILAGARLADTLRSAGYAVIEVSSDLAFSLAGSLRLDAALLADHAGVEVVALTSVLGRCGIPFAVLDGDDSGTLPAAFRRRPRLGSSAPPAAILQCCESLLASSSELRASVKRK
jgi:hypothetical protein